MSGAERIKKNETYQKIVAAGLFIPISRFFNNIWVRPHRRPPRNEADKTRMNPRREKVVVVATMSSTPPVISAITDIRRMEGRSRWRRKAKSRTKVRDEDLTMV